MIYIHIVFVDHLHKTKKKWKRLKKEEIHDRFFKAFFQNDMACGDFQDLTRWTASDKMFYDKAFNIAKTLKYYGYF